VYFDRLYTRIADDYQNLVENRVSFSAGLHETAVAAEIESEGMTGEFGRLKKEALIQYYFDMNEHLLE
jgi:hypothetical protein